MQKTKTKNLTAQHSGSTRQNSSFAKLIHCHAVKGEDVVDL